MWTVDQGHTFVNLQMRKPTVLNQYRRDRNTRAAPSHQVESCFITCHLIKAVCQNCACSMRVHKTVFQYANQCSCAIAVSTLRLLTQSLCSLRVIVLWNCEARLYMWLLVCAVNGYLTTSLTRNRDHPETQAKKGDDIKMDLRGQC